MKNLDFDITLLDRDCVLQKLFHILDFDKVDTDKIISISVIPEWKD